MKSSLQFWSLKGTVGYEAVHKLQLELVELRYQKKIPDTVLFLEHEPVITRGRGLQFTGTPRDRQMPLLHALPKEIYFSESERGGDLTYHGPGQLVMYPICQLDGRGFAPDHDIAGFLRKLEQLILDDLRGRGLESSIRKNASGVWVGNQKIASVGIAVRKWISYHGLAYNCVNDLKPFYLISPCGFSPEVMTRLSDWVSLGADWRSDLEKSLANRMVSDSVVLSLDLQEIQFRIDSHRGH